MQEAAAPVPTRCSDSDIEPGWGALNEGLHAGLVSAPHTILDAQASARAVTGGSCRFLPGKGTLLVWDHYAHLTDKEIVS